MVNFLVVLGWAIRKLLTPAPRDSTGRRNQETLGEYLATKWRRWREKRKGKR